MDHDLKFGLLPLPADNRDFSHDSLFGTYLQDQLTDEDFDVAQPISIKNQRYLDFCTAFAATSVSEDQEEIPLDPLYQYARACQLRNDYKTWGMDLRQMAKSLTEYGSLPQDKAITSVPLGDYDRNQRDALANWENYPINLDEIAIEHIKRSFVFVDGPHDTFDNIRAALYMHRNEKKSVLAGAYWGLEWQNAPDGIIPKVYTKGNSAHSVKIFGQKKINGEIYLKVQNSYGQEIGDKGIFYFPREVVNKEFAPFGQIMFADIGKDDAKWLIEHKLKFYDSWVIKLLKKLIDMLTGINAKKNE